MMNGQEFYVLMDENKRTLFVGSKYFKVKLKDTFDDTDGYLVQCYWNITVILNVSSDWAKRAQYNIATKSHSNNTPRHLILECNHQVLQQILEFWKMVVWNRQLEKLENCENLPANEGIVNDTQTLNNSLIFRKISWIDLIVKEVYINFRDKFISTKHWEKLSQKCIVLKWYQSAFKLFNCMFRKYS